MSTGKIGVTSENLFPIIKKFLYSEHDIFLREIISNAVDATQKLKILASKGEYKSDMTGAKIRVVLDKKAKTLISQRFRNWYDRRRDRAVYQPDCFLQRQ